MRNRSARHEEYLRQREKGFDNDFGVRSKLPEYNALRDENMKQFFENSHLQKHLWKTGQIDRSGSVIDLDRNNSKLRIIEKEFRRAENAEYTLQKEEEDERLVVRRKKLNKLRDSIRDQRILRIKDDFKIKEEVNAAKKQALDLIRSPALPHTCAET